MMRMRFGSAIAWSNSAHVLACFGSVMLESLKRQVVGKDGSLGPATRKRFVAWDVTRGTTGAFNHHTYTARARKARPLNNSFFRRGENGRSAQMCCFDRSSRLNPHRRGMLGEMGRNRDERLTSFGHTTGRRTAGRRLDSSLPMRTPKPS